MAEEATVEGLLGAIARSAEFNLRKLADAIERRQIPRDIEMLLNLVENAYPYVSLMRSFQNEFELPPEWSAAIDGFWNDFNYMREIVMEAPRRHARA